MKEWARKELFNSSLGFDSEILQKRDHCEACLDLETILQLLTRRICVSVDEGDRWAGKMMVVGGQGLVARA